MLFVDGKTTDFDYVREVWCLFETKRKRCRFWTIACTVRNRQFIFIVFLSYWKSAVDFFLNFSIQQNTMVHEQNRSVMGTRLKFCFLLTFYLSVKYFLQCSSRELVVFTLVIITNLVMTIHLKIYIILSNASYIFTYISKPHARHLNFL